jgi:hypothetical protein
MTIDAPVVDFPEPTFAGQNLFSEPSTESIVLETMPEAISMPIETWGDCHNGVNRGYFRPNDRTQHRST